MCVDDHPHYGNKMRRIVEVFGMSENLLMTSACLDDGPFDARFDALLENPSAPKRPMACLLICSECLMKSAVQL